MFVTSYFHKEILFNPSFFFFFSKISSFVFVCICNIICAECSTHFGSEFGDFKIAFCVVTGWPEEEGAVIEYLYSLPFSFIL